MSCILRSTLTTHYRRHRILWVLRGTEEAVVNARTGMFVVVPRTVVTVVVPRTAVTVVVPRTGEVVVANPRTGVAVEGSRTRVVVENSRTRVAVVGSRTGEVAVANSRTGVVVVVNLRTGVVVFVNPRTDAVVVDFRIVHRVAVEDLVEDWSRKENIQEQKELANIHSQARGNGALEGLMAACNQERCTRSLHSRQLVHYWKPSSTQFRDGDATLYNRGYPQSHESCTHAYACPSCPSCPSYPYPYPYPCPCPCPSSPCPSSPSGVFRPHPDSAAGTTGLLSLHLRALESWKGGQEAKVQRMTNEQNHPFLQEWVSTRKFQP